jgi:acetyl esterase/lipase
VTVTRASRRSVLGGLLGGLSGVPLAGCADVEQRSSAPVVEDAAVPETHRYGDDPSQYAELTLPSGSPHGLVVVLHGGFWKAAYGAELGRPLAERVAALGWVAWNVEYRRVGAGGGFPMTLDDVHAAIELAGEQVPGVSRVVTLGHSAGGHLATWAAARARFDRWRPARVEVTHVVSQAGVLDLTRAHADALGSGAVAALMGAGPEAPAYDLADPQRQLPLDVPVWCVHARDDDTVPFAQSEDYVAAATEAGSEASLVEVEGGHFAVIDVDSPAWAAIEGIFDGLAG